LGLGATGGLLRGELLLDPNSVSFGSGGGAGDTTGNFPDLGSEAVDLAGDSSCAPVVLIGLSMMSIECCKSARLRDKSSAKSTDCAGVEVSLG